MAVGGFKDECGCVLWMFVTKTLLWVQRGVTRDSMWPRRPISYAWCFLPPVLVRSTPWGARPKGWSQVARTGWRDRCFLWHCHHLQRCLHLHRHRQLCQCHHDRCLRRSWRCCLRCLQASGRSAAPGTAGSQGTVVVRSGSLPLRLRTA